MILDLICMTIVIVFIIDLSGFINELKQALSKWLTKGKMISNSYRIKPFDCSLCMTFWSGMIYLLAVHSFNLPMILLVCILAFLTPVISDILFLIKDMLTKLINTISNKLC